MGGGASAFAGPTVSNAETSKDLAGWFSEANARAGVGPCGVAASGATGRSADGQRQICRGTAGPAVSRGVPGVPPVTVQRTYTWVFEPYFRP